MSKEAIRKNIQQLGKRIKDSPRVWTFRGRRVVPAEKWRWADWATFPDSYVIFIFCATAMPDEWATDYLALLYRIKDPLFGWHTCWNCAIKQAQDARKDIDRDTEGWASRGGEEARQKFYDGCEKSHAEKFRRQDAMQKARLRVFSEFGGAGDRTCAVLNFFKCPYGKEYRTLLENGRAADTLWEHIVWYDRHWNRDQGSRPPDSARKWYHYDEPPIIDVSSFDDIRKALDDGRLDRIAAEHKRYMKETGYEGWAI